MFEWRGRWSLVVEIERESREEIVGPVDADGMNKKEEQFVEK